MNKKTIRDIDVSGKRVLLHCDFNIKLRRQNGELVPVSDIRLKTHFPSIFFLLEKRAKIIFISYLERPGGKVVESLRLAPVAKRLSFLINRQIQALPDCIGPKVRSFIDKMEPAEMVMLENTRFHPGEEEDSDRFARELARNGDLMVQDAFGHSHRVHASTTGIARHIPAVAGFYLEGEVEMFDKLMKSPKKPLVLLIGGTKAYDKIRAVENLNSVADRVLVGGAVANNFLKAKGLEVGSSFLDEPYVDKAKKQKVDIVKLAGELLERYPEKIILPQDFVKKKGAILDIGPRTIKQYCRIIKSAKTIFWDGPMGKYEEARFRRGTLKIAEAVARNPNTTILAGGDTAALAENFGFMFRYTYVSIAGGAALEYLAGKKLPGIEALLGK